MNKEKSTKEYLSEIQKTLLGLKDVLSFKEACVYTGISPNYMYRLTSTNSIPFSKSRKFIFFDRKRLDERLIESPRKTKKEIEQEAMPHIAKK